MPFSEGTILESGKQPRRSEAGRISFRTNLLEPDTSILIIKHYPLGELSNLNFDVVDISIEVHFVYKLYGSHGGNFGEYSCFEPRE